MIRTQPIVIAVFETEKQAEEAVNELCDAGFRLDQLRYAKLPMIGCEDRPQDRLASIGSLLSRSDTGEIYHELRAMGVLPDDAQFYEQLYRTHAVFLAVMAGERMGEARYILHRHTKLTEIWGIPSEGEYDILYQKYGNIRTS